MASGIYCELTEQQLESYITLLADKGVSAIPTGRLTFEDLEQQGAESFVKTDGLLRFAGEEFAYELRSDSVANRFHVVAPRGTVEPPEELLVAVEGAFPEARTCSEVVQPEETPSSRTTFTRASVAVVCTAFVLFIVAVWVFAALGVRQLLR